MKLKQMMFLAVMGLSAVTAHSIAAEGVRDVLSAKQNQLVLSLHTNTETPGAKLANGQFLIVNKARYYNVVEAVFTENKKFLWFQGWDNGEMTVFKPKDYQYWSPLPLK